MFRMLRRQGGKPEAEQDAEAETSGPLFASAASTGKKSVEVEASEVNARFRSVLDAANMPAGTRASMEASYSLEEKWAFIVSYHAREVSGPLRHWCPSAAKVQRAACSLRLEAWAPCPSPGQAECGCRFGAADASAIWSAPVRSWLLGAPQGPRRPSTTRTWPHALTKGPEATACAAASWSVVVAHRLENRSPASPLARRLRPFQMFARRRLQRQSRGQRSPRSSRLRSRRRSGPPPSRGSGSL